MGAHSAFNRGTFDPPIVGLVFQTFGAITTVFVWLELTNYHRNNFIPYSAKLDRNGQRYSRISFVTSILWRPTSPLVATELSGLFLVSRAQF